MTNIANLLTEHMAIWTAAESKQKSGRGRASGNTGNVYGVKKLRELILELAVRGKLVPQDPNDEPASELLKRIQIEKAKLIAEGKLKKEKPLAPIGDDEKPFELPNGWLLVRLEDVGNTFIGLTYSPKDISNEGVPVLRSSNIQNGKIDLDDLVRVKKEIKGNLFVENGDLLICARNGSKALVGKTAMIKNLSEPMVFGAFMAIYKSQLNEYIEIFLNSPLFRKFLDGVETTTINQITQNNLKTTLLPLPPLAEQHRIVAKVDELMALCDQLEQQHSNAQEAHETLVSQLLATFTQSQNAAEFNANWQRIYTHFDVLFTTEASIDALKQTLLQLAVMGKLVPQDPDEEPASELLKRIQAEKAKLIAEGKFKKQKPLAPISEDEKPFELPKGWEWLRLGELFTFEYGDNLPEPKRTNTGEYPVYGSNGIVGTHNECFVNSKCIVIGRKGSAGALNLSLSDGCCVTDVAYYCIPHNDLNLLFTFKLFHTLGFDELGKGIKPGLNRNEAYALIIAIPPFKEQQRIVAKVDELIELCDQLKTRIQQASQQQRAIANTLVAQAVNQ